MNRQAFAFGTLAMVGTASAANATGGLDVWEPDLPTPAPIPILPGDVHLPLRILNRRRGTIATLSVDEYLYGVVPLEVSHAWPSAMLQAQAIVARTYAVGHRSPARPYDLVDDDDDQMYGGPAVQTPATNAAVDATSGAIVTYNRAAASVFYMACCGGHTEDAAELWGRNTLPYLRGVVDPWCAGTPDYRWEETVPASRFAAALGAEINGIGSMQSIEPIDFDPAGRPRNLMVRGGSRSVEVAVAELRRALGPQLLPSAYIQQITLARDSQILIVGAGRGHGVGLCQWGGRAMAMQGHDAEAIVRFYFPGTTVARA